MQFESQKRELEQTITVKREKKKESMTLRLKEKEQQMTSNLVQKQSQQMLELLAVKKEELKRDLERELEAQVTSDTSEVDYKTGNSDISILLNKSVVRLTRIKVKICDNISMLIL